MPMIGRVARAICDSENDPPGIDCTCEPGTCLSPTARQYARAAIAAMREPTEAMTETGNHYTHCGGSCGNRAGRDTWQAMIDAALSLPPAPDPTPIVTKTLA